MEQQSELRKELINHYLQVCKLDVESLKPGNISLYSGGKDLSVDDFLNSAKASAEPITDPALSLGSRILHAISATQVAVHTNTNLGMVLLMAPLVQAMFNKALDESLRDSIIKVLTSSTVQDALHVYQAIRIAKPGGMGEKNNQDISQEPTVTLLNTMKIASEWDMVAAQYSNNFDDIFNFGVPRYHALMKKWGDEKWATAGLFLSYLRYYPDSLIERKFGLLKAREISDMISALEMELYQSDSPSRYEAQLLEIDRQLKRNLINPGTSADLTAASIFAAGLI
ncbi:MAG: triphosphoribosyl-dephospho-CoA synthase [Gammaproteobacteria bacterium]